MDAIQVQAKRLWPELKHFHNSVAAMTAKAKENLWWGNYTNAAVLFEQALHATRSGQSDRCVSERWDPQYQQSRNDSQGSQATHWPYWALNVQVAQVCYEFAATLMFQKKFHEARSVAVEALSLREDALGCLNDRTIESTLQVAAIEDALGDGQKAIEMCLFNIPWHRQSVGPSLNEIHYANACIVLGTAMRRKGANAKAAVLYQKGLRIYQLCLKASESCVEYPESMEHQDQGLNQLRLKIVVSLTGLGMAYSALQNTVEAIESFIEALAICFRVFGDAPKHPVVAEASWNLDAQLHVCRQHQLIQINWRPAVYQHLWRPAHTAACPHCKPGDKHRYPVV